MEIHDYWRVTQIVRDIPTGREFSTTIVNRLLKELFSITRKASLTLELMSCIEKTHAGSLGGQGDSRDPNRYIRLSSSDELCDDCVMQSCMIRHSRMAAQIGLDRRINIPIEELI